MVIIFLMNVPFDHATNIVTLLIFKYHAYEL
jgi:hypothetical protein